MTFEAAAPSSAPLYDPSVRATWMRFLLSHQYHPASVWLYQTAQRFKRGGVLGFDVINFGKALKADYGYEKKVHGSIVDFLNYMTHNHASSIIELMTNE